LPTCLESDKYGKKLIDFQQFSISRSSKAGSYEIVRDLRICTVTHCSPILLAVNGQLFGSSCVAELRHVRKLRDGDQIVLWKNGWNKDEAWEKAFDRASYEALYDSDVSIGRKLIKIFQ
jgi:hypothetical protein